MTKLWRLRSFRFLVLWALMVMGALSCSMTNHVVLNSDGSGEVDTEVVIAAAFVEYLQSFAFLSPDLAYLSEGIFQEEQLLQGAAENQNLDVTDLAVLRIRDEDDPERTPSEQLRMGIRFSSIDDLIKNEDTIAQTDILRFTKGPEGQTLAIYLDKENYRQLYTLFPMLDNPLFEGLGPTEEEIKEDEYVEMMVGVLGNEGPDILRNSMVDLKVTVKGTLVSQTGGETDGNTVTFRLPLLKVLLLNQTVEYSLTFQ